MQCTYYHVCGQLGGLHPLRYFKNSWLICYTQDVRHSKVNAPSMAVLRSVWV